VKKKNLKPLAKSRIKDYKTVEVDQAGNEVTK
jgi:hypothetical protein